MKRKLILTIITIILITTLIPTAVKKTGAISGKCGENASWQFEDDVLTIRGTGAVTEAPWKDSSGSWKYTPKKLVVEEGITELGKQIFMNGNKKVFREGIDLPESLKKIGEEAFANSKIASINIPGGVENIEESAFAKCKALKQVTIAGNVKRIEKRAFWECVLLKEVKMKEDNDCEWMGESVFEECRSLQKITLPHSLRDLGKNAFYDCENLESVELPQGMVIIPENAFIYCVNLKNVSIPDTVKEVGRQAFTNCNHLEKIQLPDNLQIIGERAFAYCALLKELVIPDTVTTIGKRAIEDCYSLKKLHLPVNLQIIPAKLLCGCVQLKQFTFPKHTKEIGKQALAGCDSLQKIEIPSEVVKVKAFDQDCPKLLTIVNHAGVTYSLRSSKQVKNWYLKKKKVTQVKPGQTVTAEGKKFKITYETTTKGEKCKIIGKQPKTYQYGNPPKQPQGIKLLTNESIYQYIFMGWKYESKDKKYKNGRIRSYYDALQKKVSAEIKGDLVVSPRVARVNAYREKNGDTYVYFMEGNANIAPAQAKELSHEDINCHDASFEGTVQVRYANNPQMKNAVNVSSVEFWKDIPLGKWKKQKKYYVQAKILRKDYRGVPLDTPWSEVIKLHINNGLD